jgi:radical SAM superfamily enzyme YgiQ (UPF0313 family)
MAKRKLFRMIVPASSTNVFSGIMKKTISLGPLLVATIADKLPDWDVEVIHEAGCRKWIVRDAQGNVDHQTLQKERFADVAGFYGSISCSMPRLWEVAKFYQSQGVLTIAGGLHAHYNPQESLRNGIDVVVHGEGEMVIKELLIRFQNRESFAEIAGISFLHDGNIFTTPTKTINSKHSDFLEGLPCPNFGLIRDCKIEVYPIGRIRGCSMNCEFCSVKGEARWYSPEKLFNIVQWLVETRGAKAFFLVDDRVEEDKEGTRQFFELIKNKYGRKLEFSVQARLDAARDKDFLALMQAAGVSRVYIGYESPIDEDLGLMKKGYKSSDMLQWTKTYHSFGFFIHAMFIFGYPAKSSSVISSKERMKRLKQFIHQAELDSIQVLKPIPLPGTTLRERLDESGQLLPLEIVPWELYDGEHACFIPKYENMTLEELQIYPSRITGWFYHSSSFWWIGIRTIIMPLDYFLRGWYSWYRSWCNEITRFEGSLLYKKWKSQNREIEFVKRIDGWAKKARRN